MLTRRKAENRAERLLFDSLSGCIRHTRDGQHLPWEGPLFSEIGRSRKETDRQFRTVRGSKYSHFECRLSFAEETA